MVIVAGRSTRSLERTMSDHRWLAGFVIAIGCLMLARATMIFIGGAFLLDIASVEQLTEYDSTVRLVLFLGIANLVFGAAAVVSGIGLWRHSSWARALWLTSAIGLVVGFIALIMATEAPWGDYLAEVFVAVWSLFAFRKHQMEGNRAL